MRTRPISLPLLSSALFWGLFAAACGGGSSPATTPGTAGTTSTAGTTGSAGTTGTAGTTGSAGTTGTGGAGTAGTTSVAGGAGMAGMSGGGGGAGNASSATPGCGMDPPATDSATAFVKHDVEVTGVDPAFITKYPPNAGTTYNWTHRNYFVRLPANYDSTKSYPVAIGTSGCGGPETVGSEGGYATLPAGQDQVIQVALSYVLSSAANSDCGGAVFADGFENSPEPQYLAAVVKDIQAKYCTDSKKVFLGGYSSGAFESITLGCANSDILRGIGVQIGGGLRQHAPMPCKGPVAAMFVVGLQDNDNPIGPLTEPLNDSLGTAPARDEVLKRNGCVGDAHAPWDANYPMCETYTGCPKEHPVVWCAITSGHLPDKLDQAVGKYRYEGLWKFWSTLP